MLVIRVWGGIGNQLFQYYFGQYLMTKYKQEVVYDDNSFGTSDELRKRELDIVDSHIAYIDVDQCRFSRFVGIKNRLYRIAFCLNSKNHFLTENSSLPKCFLENNTYYFQGYWQDYGYYRWLKENNCILIPTPELPLQLTTYLCQIHEFGYKSVSLHIRRGDYFSTKNVGIYGVCDAEYFASAVNLIQNSLGNVKFFVFSDDLQWAKDHLGDSEKYVYVKNYDISPFSYIQLMSTCYHHIISNSSFSWWGSVLDAKDDALVICPSMWTLTSKKTIALESWIKI